MRSGVILAGGNGTRLGRNRPYNKSLAMVYDRPMIEYPVQTLIDMGVNHGVIVSSPEGVADMFRNYRDTINGLDVTYETQFRPGGTAHALGHTAVEGVFPVLCGDVYLDPAPPPVEQPTLFWQDFPEAINHTVWDPRTNELVEKPTTDIGTMGIVAYAFDERVYDVIPNLQPTERGELELIDLYRYYMSQGVDMVEYQGFFGDMGSTDGLLRVANHIAFTRNVETAKIEA